VEFDMTNSSQNKPASILGTAWQRWLRTWAFYRSTIVGWLTRPVGRLQRGLRRKSRHVWRKLEIRPVYEQLEPRLVPSTTTITTLTAGALQDATGESARDYTVRVSSETGAMRDGGIVELHDAAQNDVLVGSSALSGGVAQFHAIDGHDRLYAVYLGDQRADLAPSQSATVVNPDAPKQSQLPLRFEENQGQTDPSVQFTSHGSGYDLFLTKSEAVFVLPTNAGPRQGPGDDVQTPGAPDVVRMQFIGANPDPTARGSSILVTRSNYFKGGDPANWHVDIPNYAKVTYDDVYPGIDLVYYGSDTERRLEFDFVVAPGADPGVIRMHMAGAESVDLDAYGNLVITTPSQLTLVEKAPVVYQDRADGRHAVFGRYTLEQDGIGFHLGDYDASLPLVVDPVWVYGSYLGGTGADQGNGVAVDGAGNAYIVGATESNDFPTSGGSSGSYGGNKDAYVAKYSAAGDQLLFANYLGGSSADEALGIALSLAGNIFVAGKSSSSDFPLVNEAQTAYGGSQDAFVAKFDPTGSLLLYSTLLGGSGSDSANAIAVDADEQAAVVGNTQSTDLPTQAAVSGTHASSGSGTAAFVSKLAADGSDFVFSTYYEGGGDDNANAIAMSPTGAILIGGDTTSTSLPGTMSLDTTYGGSQDGYIAKISADGQTIKSSFVGGTGADIVKSVAFDFSENMYAAGGTASSDLTTTAGVLQSTKATGQDGFVAKVNSDLTSLLMSTFFGGNGSDIVNALALDPSNNLSLAGETASTNLTMSSALQSTNAGGKDAFYAQLNSAGASLLYSTYEGTSGDDAALGVAVDPSGDATIAGVTVGTGFPTKSPFQSSFGGGASDAFVTKIGATPPPAALTGISNDSGDSATDFITNDPTLTLSGTAEKSSTVSVYRGGVGLLGTASANGSGAWSYNYTATTLPEGVTAFNFTTTVGGVVSRMSRPFYVTIDTTAPTVSVIMPSTTADLRPQMMARVWDGVRVTNGATVTFDIDRNNNGSFADANETAAQTVALSGAVADTALAATPALSTGTVQMRAYVTDTAGNVGTSMNKQVIIGAQTSLAVSLLTPGADAWYALNLPTNMSPGHTVDCCGNSSSVDPGFALQPGPDLDPHFSINPGANTDPGFYVNPGPNSDPGMVRRFPQPRTVGGVNQTGGLSLFGGVNPGGTLTTSVPIDLQNSPGSAPCCGDALNYQPSKVSAQPTIQFSIATPNNAVLPNDYTVQLTFNGSAQTPQVYSTSGYSQGDTLVAAQQVSSAITTTGRYNYQVDVTPTGGSPTSVTGTMYVVADNDSVLGVKGWSLSSVDRLYAYAASGGDPAGVLRVSGNGGSAFYQTSGGGYTSPAGDFGTLANAGGGAYTYTLPTGEVWAFDSAGLQTKITSADGKASTTYTYSSNKIATITAPDGAISTFAYSSGELSTITTGSRVTTFTRSGGQITDITDAAGGVRQFGYSGKSIATDTWDSAQITYAYSASGALSGWTKGTGSEAGSYTITPPAAQGLSALAASALEANVGNSTANASVRLRVDSNGRTLKEIRTDGAEWNFSRDANGLATVVTDPLGRVTTYAFDAAGAVTQITFADGNTQAFAYQAGHHALTTFTDERGKVTTYSYDGDGHMLTRTQHDSAVTITTSYAYNSTSGLLTTFTNAIGVTTIYQYDAQRRLGTITHFDGSTEKYAYDANGSLGTMVDARGNTFTYTNDALGRLVGWVDGEGKRGTLTRDAQSRVTQSIDPLEVVTDFTYNGWGEVERVVQADGTPLARVLALNTYDDLGQLASTRDPRGNTTQLAVDGVGRVVRVTDANQGVSRNAFDWAGQLKEASDALGFTTKATFNTRGMPATVTDAAAGLSTLAYDAAMNLTTFTDARGKNWLTSYDDLGRPVTATDPNGNKTTTTYDNVGNVILVTDPYGKKTTITFDFAARTVAVTDRNIHKSTTTYDANYNAVSYQDARTNTATIVYDKNNRVKATTDFNNKATTLTLDNAGNLLTSTDPLVHTFTVDRDDLGRAIGFTNAENETSTQGLDAGDLPILSTDANGNDTRISYDALGRPIAIQDALGNVARTDYDANGNVLTTTDPRGNKTQYLYDTLNRPIKITDAAGNSTQSAYDANGNLTVATDGNSQKTTYVYDDGNRRTSMQTPVGTSVYTYDNNDLLLTVTNPNNNKTTYTYNDGGLLTKITSPDNTSVVYSYDANDNREVVIDPSGNRTTFTFNNNNLVSTTLDPFNKTTTYEYDFASRNTAIVDRLARRREFTFDNANRLTQELWKNSGGTVVGTLAFSYDDAGNLTGTDKTDGVDTYQYTLTYDQLNRPETVAEPFDKTLTFSYDAAGNRTNLLNSYNGVITSTFNNLNLLSSRQIVDGDGHAFRVDLEYTNRHQIGTMTRYDDAAGTDKIGESLYTYDNAMRLTNINHKNGAGTSLASYIYSYDAGSRLSTQKISAGAVTTFSYDTVDQLSGDGATTWTYDSAGNRTSQGSSPTTGNRLSDDGTYNYTYDFEGNVTEKAQIAGSVKWQYYYDNRNELTRVDHITTGTTVDLRVDYKYDAWGNRVQTLTGVPQGTGTGAAQGQYANSVIAFSSQFSVGPWSASQATGAPDVPVYSDHGNAWAASNAQKDNAGYLSLGIATNVYANGVTITESWNNGFVTQIDVIDTSNNLHTVWTGTDPTTGGAIRDFHVDFPQTSYLVKGVKIYVDGAHVLNDWEEIDAVKVHGVTQYGSVEQDTRYAYDGWNPAKQGGIGNEAWDIWADMDADNQVTTVYFDGDGIDDKWARVTSGNDERWLLQDRLGSIRDITDHDGAPVNTIAYDPWGNVLSQTAGGVDELGRYAWTGREVDVETGLQYNRARYYDPSTGRWLNQDPLGFDAGDSNLYRYVNNAPTNGTDPSGLRVVRAWVSDPSFDNLSGPNELYFYVPDDVPTDKTTDYIRSNTFYKGPIALDSMPPTATQMVNEFGKDPDGQKQVADVLNKTSARGGRTGTGETRAKWAYVTFLLKQNSKKYDIDLNELSKVVDGTTIPWGPQRCQRWTEAAEKRVKDAFKGRLLPTGELLDSKGNRTGVYFGQTSWIYDRVIGNLWGIFDDAHFGLRISFPDGSVVYLDRGNWGHMFMGEWVPSYGHGGR
jgi:RHS repeat-associated protein